MYGLFLFKMLLYRYIKCLEERNMEIRKFNTWRQMRNRHRIDMTEEANREMEQIKQYEASHDGSAEGCRVKTSMPKIFDRHAAERAEFLKEESHLEDAFYSEMENIEYAVDGEMGDVFMAVGMDIQEVTLRPEVKRAFNRAEKRYMRNVVM